MKAVTVILSIVLIGFLALTACAVSQVGYVGILEGGLASWGSVQIFADLVIACSLAVVWMVVDARERGLNPWPFVVVTLFAGSFGPLLYLLRRGRAAATASGFNSAVSGA